jgi:hypothetical protein
MATYYSEIVRKIPMESFYQRNMTDFVSPSFVEDVELSNATF